MAKVFFLLFKLNIMTPGLHLYFELSDDTTISMSSFHARLPNHIGQERHLGEKKVSRIVRFQLPIFVGNMICPFVANNRVPVLSRKLWQ